MIKVHLYCSERESENIYFSLPSTLFTLQRFLSEAISVFHCLHVLNKGLETSTLSCFDVHADPGVILSTSLRHFSVLRTVFCIIGAKFII